MKRFLIKTNLYVFFILFFLVNSNGAYPYPKEGQDNVPGMWSLWALDTIIFTSDDKKWLPSGRYSGTILEQWLNPAINSQIETGGIARLDHLRYTSHGRSWTQKKWLLNYIDVTDPLNPGMPLIQPPWNSWKLMLWSSLQHNDVDFTGNAVNWIVNPEKPGFSFKTTFTFAQNVGGPLIIPSKMLDREPATDYGIDITKRRKIKQNYEGSMALSWVNPASGNRLLVSCEYLRLDRSFPMLDSNDKGESLTALVFYQTDLAKNVPINLIVAGQNLSRTNLGAEKIMREEHTVNLNRVAGHGQISSQIPFQRGQINIGTGISYGEDDITPLDSSKQLSTDLISDEAYLGTPHQKGFGYRHVFDTYLNYNKRIESWLFDVGIKYKQETISFEPYIANSITQRTYYDSPLYMTLWEETELYTNIIHTAKGYLRFEKQYKRFLIKGNAGLDYTEGIVSGIEGDIANWLSPFGKLNAEYKLSKSKDSWTLGAGYMREPEKLTNIYLDFLNPQSPSGREYMWIDDGDGIAEEGEEDFVIRNTGGTYHSRDNDLSRPYTDELFLGIKGNLSKKWKFLAQGSYRWFVNRFTVRYPSSMQNIYTEEEFGYTSAQERDPSTFGSEEYILTNDDGLTSFYQDLMVQFRGPIIDNLWYMNLSAMAFRVQGSAPFGNGPDYNDYGIIDESSADVNYDYNKNGRLDSDRGYAINIACFVKLFSNKRDGSFGIGSAFRYRDGQPFSKHIPHEGMSQGPVFTQSTPRGFARYTFAMNWDLRFAYEIQIGKHSLFLALDMFNVLGSATELTEVNIEGYSFRKPIEITPPRMIRLICSFEY